MGREAPRNLGERATPWLFLLPSGIGVIGFVVFPLLFSLVVSFFVWDLFTEPEFVGANNYVELITEDPLFWTAVTNTLVYTVMTMAASVVISLFLASVLAVRLRGADFFRILLFLPVIASPVAIAVIWRWMFAQTGVLNSVLDDFGLGPVGWLTDERLALLSVSVTSIWKNVGIFTVILLGAILAVPQAILEAARVDGAGPVRRFFSVILPLILPALSFVLIIGMIMSFQVFDQVYVLTGANGGPGTSTYVYGVMLFQNGFSLFKMGYASAMGWILFVALLALTILQLRLSRSLTARTYQ